MKPVIIFVLSALALLASPAAAQHRSVSSGARVTYPSANSSLGTNMPPACRHNCFSWERGHHGFRSGFPGVLIVLRQAQDDRIQSEPVVVKEVVRESGPPPPPAAAANSGTPNRDVPGLPKRKPYVIGASYASLPGGCMKLIDEGVSFYYCSGEWYREVRGGRDPLYRAVARKL